MNEDRTEKKFLQSYVYGESGAFFVSTCYRASSAALAYDMWYYETFAWEWDEKTSKRGEWVADHSGARSPEKAREQHMEVVVQLQEKGEFKDAQET